MRIRSRQSNLRSRGLLAAGLAALLLAAVPATASAVTASTWTWSDATHPAGSAQVAGGTSGAGLYLSRGMYYIPGVGHMAQPLGSWKYETAPSGSGLLGKVLYTTYTTSTQHPDIALVGTGTKPIVPRIPVSAGWQDAWIMDVGHPGEQTEGRTLCHSGRSVETAAAGGYQCGTVWLTCTANSTWCYLKSASRISFGGDSGGPVWDYAPGGVELHGWITGSAESRDSAGNRIYLARYVPIWAVQNYNWSVTETIASEGYLTGADPAGCFVTYYGCVRS